MSDLESPTPPADLRERGRTLWTDTLARFGLAAHELMTLHEACRTADRLERLAVEGRDAPLTAVDRKGDPVASPLLVEARQQQIVLIRLIASLRFPEDEFSVRPQRRSGARGAYAARSEHNPARWIPRSS